jgi:hemerythrin
MKSLSETRTLLLSQHDELRELIAAALHAFSSDPVDQPALEAALGRLIVCLREHNATEEDALRNVLPELDVFGAVRKSVMISDHMAEHEELHSLLVAAGAGADRESLARTSAMLDRLLGHMEHEENLFLDPKLLDEKKAP